MSDLVLLAVPGSDGEAGALRPVLRVVVVPRLDPATGIGGTGMEHWPDTLGAARFDVEFDDGPPVTGLTPVHGADGALWHAVVNRLPVRAAPQPVAAPPVTVEPTSDLADAVDATYRAAAAAEVPDGAERADLHAATADALRSTWQDGAAPTSPPAAPQAVPEADRASRATPPAADPDFHTVLAALREHPRVSRALGLVFDLPIDPARLAATGTVRVRWPAPPPGVPTPLSPATAYEVHPERGFLPASSAGVVAGLVDVGDTAGWAVATVDVEGAVGRLRDAAASLEAGGRPVLPALRSAGLTLLRRGRAADLDGRRAAAAAVSDLSAVTLTADDLVLGLRLDVRFKGGEAWTSLHRRIAAYAVAGTVVGEDGEEEGHLKQGAVVDDGAGLRADEVVARWAGWSLAVASARPSAARADRAAGAPRAPFEVTRDFTVPPGSLLPLRFGRDYQLRVRVADVAGGGVGVADPDTTAGTPPVAYVRAEPVGSPVLGLPEGTGATGLGPGGTVEHLVVRSDAPDYPRNDQRVLTPPSTTLDLAEQHGMLDGRDAATFAVVQRALEQGHLPDPAAEGVMVFPVTEPGGLDERPHLPGWTGQWPLAIPKTLLLETRAADAPGAALAVGADTVSVRLRPAEQLVVELSSFLRDGFLGHLALQQWRSSSAPTQVVKDGRHPMATPARRVTLVHAVRAPLREPAGRLDPGRQPGDTAVELSPVPALLDLDAASTAQVHLSAAWREVDDSGARDVAGVAVQIAPVERGDTALPPLRHDLASTRHRDVVYTVTAVSRFRDLYLPDEDGERFVRRVTLPSVSVPSTVRPQALRPITVLPSFRWESDHGTAGVVVRRRLGGRLRVELARPWFTTGDGECLAVVLSARAPIDPSAPIDLVAAEVSEVKDERAERDHVTEVARDPVFVTGGPDPARWPAADAFAPTGGPVATVPLPETGLDVVAVPFAVYPHEDAWAADVVCPGLAAGAYRPFVRLALGRYQPASLSGLWLSPVVRGPLVPVMPDRELTVDTRVPGEVSVTLSGVGPAAPLPNRLDVVLESAPLSGGSPVSALDPASAGGVGWAPVSGGTASTAVPGCVMMPLPQGAGLLRVRVREVEAAVAAPGALTPATSTAAELAERAVFTDVIDLLLPADH